MSHSATRRIFLNPFVLFGLILASLVVRCWDAVMRPVLAAEDGTVLFVRYFHAQDLSAVLEFYAGYLSLVSNLIAWLATRGPVQYVPLIFVGSALFFGALGFYLLTRPAFSWLVKEPVDRALLVMVICLLPIGRGVFYSNLCYSQWSLLFVLVVLVSGRLSDSRIMLLISFLGASLCVFAHPLSLIVLPICAVHFWFEKRRAQRVWLGACMFVVVFYQIVGVERGAPVNLSFDSVRLAVKFWLSRVLFEGVVGAKAAVGLMASSPHYVSLLGASLFGAFCLLYLRSSVSLVLRGAAVVGVGVAAACLFIGAVVRISQLPVVEQLNPHLQRYFYISKLILAILLLAQVIPWLRQRISVWRLPSKIVFTLSGSLYLLALNSSNSFLYYSSREEGVALQSFLKDVGAEVERARSGQPYRAHWEFTRPQEWARSWGIKINIDQHISTSEGAGLR